MEDQQEGPPPVFDALTTSARQIFILLKCIGFMSKAQMQISSDGVRVTVEDSHVMQGHAFIDKALFNKYAFNPRRNLTPEGNSQDDDDDDDDQIVSFGISLTALLECLQIFGAESSRWGGSGGSGGGWGGSTAGGSGGGGLLDHGLLRINGTCRMHYSGEGHPLCLILEENNMTTTCELTTYTPTLMLDIPLSRTSLSRKIILKSPLLHDAILELASSSSPDSLLTITSSPTAPFFTLSSASPLGSTVVEFSNDKDLLETFQVPVTAHSSYRFALVKYAVRAMAVASKVSIRGDDVGVLSLQFMVEWEGKPSFIDFRFLPVEEGEEEEEGGGEAGTAGDTEDADEQE